MTLKIGKTLDGKPFAIEADDITTKACAFIGIRGSGKYLAVIVALSLFFAFECRIFAGSKSCMLQSIVFDISQSRESARTPEVLCSALDTLGFLHIGGNMLTDDQLRVKLKSRIKIDETGCWLWRGTKSVGYGKLTVNNKVVWAHRLSYELFVGPVGDGLYVCHKCDVHACINPDHLFAGTQTDNMRDCFNKGRGSEPPRHYGLANSNVTLTDAQVAEIRAKRAAGISQRTVAKEYGCSQSTVWRLTHKIYRKDAA